MSRAGTGPGTTPRRGTRSDDSLIGFLVDRLTEELAALWVRDADSTRTDGRPGLAAQVAVLDELLVGLHAGLLPPRRDLRVVLYGYGHHPDYDPAWVARLG